MRLLLLLLTIWVMSALAAPLVSADEPLRYRLLVFSRDSSRVAVDGSIVGVYGDRGLPPSSGMGGPRLCTEATVRDGWAEVEVVFSENCPEGVTIRFLLSLQDGQGLITAASVPPLEWRYARPGEETTREAVVRLIPPSSHSNRAAGATNICGLQQLRRLSGGEAIRFGTPQGTLVLSLPPGGDYQFSIPGEVIGLGPGLAVCDLTTASTVFIDPATGAEMARSTSGAGGDVALNRILAGVRVERRAGAPPGITLRPPVTGDAGLR